MSSQQALLVIDLQNGVCYGQNELFDLEPLLAKVNQRIADYRRQQLPIIFIQHEDEELVKGCESWQLVPQLKNLPEDYYVGKTHANSFYQTNLQELLQELAIKNLEIVGAQTQYCVDSTIKFAHGLGYTLFLQRNGTSTLDNPFMTAATTIAFYEDLWDQRFATFL